MTDIEKLMKAGCGIDSFCAHSGGHHACRYMANHPDNKSCPHICVNGSYFAINPNISEKTINSFLECFDNSL